MATAKGPRTQRYHPASEFDNTTLAKKREYWRTKKREQRAKVAAVRKKLGVENARVYDARRNVLSAHMQNAASGPTLLNSDRSHQTNVCDSSELGLLTSSCGEQVEKTGVNEVLVAGACVPGSSRKLKNVSPGQRVRWFQKIKLNRVLPKFPEGSGPPQGGAMGCRKVVRTSTAGPLVASNTLAKSNGSLLNTNVPVPAVRVTVHPATTVNHRIPSRIAATNGTSSVQVYNQSLPPNGVPGLNDHKRPQVKVQIPRKALPLSVTNKVGVDVKQCPSDVSCANMKTEQCALATTLTRPLERQTPETEEERAVRRREIWRVKKREQRAKRAAKIVKERERIQRMGVPAQERAQAVGVAFNSSRLSRQGQRQAVNRARIPCVLASQTQRSNHALALSGPIPKSINTAIAIKSEGSSLTNHIVIDPEPPSGVVKTGDPKQNKAFYAPSTTTATCVVSNNMKLEHGITYAPKGVTAQFSNTAKYKYNSRIQINTFIRTQKFLYRNTRLSLSPFYENPEETVEERMARKREYWRIKKREQRAKLSSDVKTKLRERDSLVRRVKRYQGILEEMRWARAESQKAQQPRINTITSTSEAIGGFIKEDGTVTIGIPTPSFAKGTESGVEMVSPTKPLFPFPHFNVSTSRDCASFSGHMNVNPPPLQKRAVQLKNNYPVRVSVQTPPKLVCIRPRLVSNNHHNKFTNSSPSTSQINVSAPDHAQNMINDTTNFRRIGNVARAVGTASVAAALYPNEKITEEERIARKREYWRIKKREQRAERAARLRQGLLRGRAIAAKRRRLNQIPLSSPCVVRQTTNMNPSVPVNTSTSLPTPPSIDALPAERVKQEQELSVKEEVNPPLEQPLSNDIKPSLTPPSEPPSEADPSGSTDTQATTLLAVASMKKLLEESLSTVVSSDAPDTNIKMEEPQCKTEVEPLPVEESTTPAIKPDPVLDPVEESVEADIPGPVCFSAEDAHLQTSEHSGGHTLPPSPPLLVSPHSSQDIPPSSYASSCPEVMASSASTTPASLCSSQYLPCTQTSPPLASPQTVQRDCSPRARLKPSCSLKTSNQQPPDHQQQHGSEVPNETSVLERKREYWKFMKRQQRARKAQEKQGFRPGKTATRTFQAPNFVTGAQRPIPSSYPKASLPLNKSLSSACTLQRKTHLTAVHPLPTVHVVSPPVSEANQQQSFHQYGSCSGGSPIAQKSAQPVCPPRADLQGLRTHVPVLSPPLVQQGAVPTGGSRHVPPLVQQGAVPTGGSRLVPPLVQQGAVPTGGSRHVPPLVQQGTVPTGGSRRVPPLVQQGTVPTGGSRRVPPLVQQGTVPMGGSRRVPPLVQQGAVPVPSGEKTGPLLLVENRRNSAPGHMQGVRRWNLQVQTGTLMPPAATLTPTPNYRPSQPIGRVAPPFNNNYKSPAKHPHTLSPHKHTQASAVDGDDDVMRRKREYWRVKKKEQRAKKAARERGLGHLDMPPPWEPVLPTLNQLPHNFQSQDSTQWFNASEETDLTLSSPVDADLGYLGVHSHAEPMKEEAEMVFQNDAEDDICPSGPSFASAWRNRYLMDYDPLNQLLVCMVCGEQQYSHSLAGARAHIEEAHPETLSLGQQERWKLQEAWDEQVAQREQFFTSQLQQHTTAHTESIAEVEVTVDMDDPSQSIYSKSAKTKNLRKF